MINTRKDKWKGEYPRSNNGLYLVLSIIFFLFVLAFFADTVLHLTNVANASESMKYQDVHSKKQMCAWIKQHPGSIINLSKNECV